MKWVRTLVLFDQGNVMSSEDWATVHESYVRSIASIDHPLGSGELTLRRKAIGDDGKMKRNGVKYLKNRFLGHMVQAEKWRAEGDVNLAPEHRQPKIKLFPSMEDYQEPISSEFGEFDFVTTGPQGTKIAIEWETGNVSSSHRSMNKLAIALKNEVIEVGVLIVPSRLCYHHLTDRIGNIAELSTYLTMWESLKVTVKKGLLAVTVVEHDHLTDDPSFPYLPVGNDGRAAEGRARTVRAKK